MDRERVKQIVRLLKSSSAMELAVREGDSTIRVCIANRWESSVPTGGTAAPAAALPAPPTAETKQDVVRVTSRLVGFFYRGRGPEQPPVAEVGDKVKEGQTVGYIESLRKLTEVVSPVAGEIVEVVGTGGQPVQFGDVLLQIRPDEATKSGKGSK
jgi:acetyl-CoA carboxylase biotin carboxyl carrier protein